MPRKIFISYRRQDSAENALAIATHLIGEFGRRNVFLDVDMAPGVKFPVDLENYLSKCKVLLALIGAQWLESRDEDGKLRLHNPDDWVRLEIARALERGIAVIPVRIGGAQLPPKAALPDNIKGLLDHQAAIVSTETFRNDIAGLVRDVRSIPTGRGRRWLTWATVAAGVSIAAWVGAYLLAELWEQQTRFIDPGRLPVEPGSGKSFRDGPRGGQPCPICPEMVMIPATPPGNFLTGSRGFLMGSENGEDHEKPLRRVTFARPFAVAKYPVTRSEFETFVNDTGYNADGGCAVFTGSGWTLHRDRSWRSPGFDQDNKHPVVCTNWADAKAYVAWLAQKTKLPYRLLTEAEWEYAARAGTSTRYFFGDNPHEICSYGNGADLTAKERFPNWKVANCRDGYVYTAPVNSFKPNAWGLNDMLGNVRQRVEDCYNTSYLGAPVDGSAWTTGDCSRRALRGGSWVNMPEELRSAYRDRGAEKEFRYDNYGFRVARSLD